MMPCRSGSHTPSLSPTRASSTSRSATKCAPPTICRVSRPAPQGKVILANGFNWQRYRVLFENGGELGDLDHRHLEPIGRTAKRIAKRAKIAARGG